MFNRHLIGTYEIKTKNKKQNPIQIIIKERKKVSSDKPANAKFHNNPENIKYCTCNVALPFALNTEYH